MPVIKQPKLSILACLALGLASQPRPPPVPIP